MARILPLILLALVGAGVFLTQAPAESRGDQCLDFYANFIPPGAEPTNTVLNGSEIRAYYRYADGEDFVVCEVDGQGAVTYSAAMNPKIDAMWQDPATRARLLRQQ